MFRQIVEVVFMFGTMVLVVTSNIQSGFCFNWDRMELSESIGDTGILF